ncbi:hypothetical protein GCM10027277_33700 [Pseudoduganella ginsengisoli]|uniref:Uncharacterized protein n=1 Tax=Pseudoduganella ginsengisoli TaxID=1462440 RepID=A0A6L6Q7B6_9BURK|nr:hypothetical protein [Pseudoduganella ginsengisoli]MTW05354.1 hypothetical protein [Pseudoduganella ginsengisoli]
MDTFLARSIACLLPSALEEGDTRLVRGIGNGFMVAYAVDNDWVRQHHLSTSGVTLADVHKQAMDNLLTLCARHIKVQQYGAIFGVFIDGKFEASMFLLQRLWQQDFANLVNKGYAIAAPARDVLAFCDMDSAEGIAELKRMVERVWNGGDHLLSRELFRIRKQS